MLNNNKICCRTKTQIFWRTKHSLFIGTLSSSLLSIVDDGCVGVLSVGLKKNAAGGYDRSQDCYAMHGVPGMHVSLYMSAHATASRFVRVVGGACNPGPANQHGVPVLWPISAACRQQRAPSAHLCKHSWCSSSSRLAPACWVLAVQPTVLIISY